MVLRDRYETTYGIYDHAAPGADDPLALILMHPNEDVITGGALHERMVAYADCDIHKYFGLSFQDFIDQPSYVIELLLEEAQKRIKKEAPLADALKKQFDQISNK